MPSNDTITIKSSYGDDNISLVSASTLDDTTVDDNATTEHRSKQELKSEVRKLRRALRQKERQLQTAAGATAGTKATRQLANSTVWSVLMIGLFFCLADVLYIMNRLETDDSMPETTESSSSTSRSSGSHGHEATAIRGKTQSKEKKPVQPWIQANHKPELGHKAQVKLTSEQTKAMVDDKGPVIRLIEAAGIEFDPYKNPDDAQLLLELPTWRNVTDMYGDSPVLYGVKEGHCQTFQAQTDPGDHFVGVAGTFNSGTNLLAELLIGNCHMAERQKKYGAKNVGVRWQVPWGKHTPPGDPEYREQHKTKKDADVDANNIMPMVTIRDPLIWLKSMCRHHYTARWITPDPNHCPDFGDPSRSFITNVKYADFSRRHDSIVHHWNDFYNEYIHEAKIPFLLVRFEDLVFHPEETTKTVCECAGGSMRRDGKFHYVVDSAKKGIGAHGSVRTGYVDALVKYGTELKRYKGYDDGVDLAYIRDHLDPVLMDVMKYPQADPDKAGMSKGEE